MQDRLKWSILALAQPAAVQMTLYPDFVCIGDELAGDFDQGLREFASPMTDEQRAAVKGLDQLITSLSGEWNAEFWLDPEALEEDVRWDEIRASARMAARAFGWPLGPPPPSDDIYISGG